MANIQKIDRKGGLTYKIIITHGRNVNGKQVRHFKTWKPPEGMSEKKAEKEVQRVAFEYEREIEQGFVDDNRQTFAEYAKYVLDMKTQGGAKHNTIREYEFLLKRINESMIGSLKLTEIRPQHLNMFYANLSEAGINAKIRAAYPKPLYQETMKAYRHADVAKAAGVSVSTVDKSTFFHVSAETAEKLSAVLGLKLEDAFTVEEAGCLAASTIHCYHIIISSVLSNAVREGLIPSNPASRANPPKPVYKEAEYLEPAEIGRILEALEDEPLLWRALIHFLLASGCRRGEAAALRWEKVDFQKGIVRIDAGIVLHGGKLSYGPTKTNRMRSVSIPQETLQLLRRHRTKQIETRLAVGDAWEGTEDYVFTRDNGLPLSPNIITNWVRNFCIRHNLPRFHPHTLRHSLASILIGNGQDVVSVSKRLGHAKTSITLDTYAHVLEKADKAASDLIGEILYPTGTKS